MGGRCRGPVDSSAGLLSRLPYRGVGRYAERRRIVDSVVPSVRRRIEANQDVARRFMTIVIASR